MVEPGEDDLPEGDDSEDFDDFAEARQPTRRDWRAAQRAGYDPPAAVRHVELSAILRGWTGWLLGKVRHEVGSKVDRLADTVERLADTVDGTRDEPGLRRTVASHAQVIGPARTAASWALRGTVAGVIVVGGFLYTRGQQEQHVTDEMQTLRETQRELRAEEKELKAEISQLRQLIQSKDNRP